MATEKYSDLLNQILPEYGVPESFFESAAENGNSCIFLVSCLKDETILYLEDSFETLTGYPAQNLVEKGLRFWFPLIHPEDMPKLSDSIIKSNELLTASGSPRPFPPLMLDYRFKLSNGGWERIKETKYLLLQAHESAIDKVLCKFEFIERAPKKSCSRLLDFALAHKEIHSKFPNPPLTEREMEILMLISKGLSTKLIADKCCISINTVETHRRHLLEKLQVKNSMELIKEASKLYSLD